MEDGGIRLEARLRDETVRLSRRFMAHLFRKNVRTIHEHIWSLLAEDEHRSEATIRKFQMARIEGSREVVRPMDFNNFDHSLARMWNVRPVSRISFVSSVDMIMSVVIHCLKRIAPRWISLRASGGVLFCPQEVAT